MITDRIQIAGLDSYFQYPANSGKINLGVIAPVTIRTGPLNKGKQLEVSGIQLLIEHEDLQKIMSFQFNDHNPLQPAPLFKLSVIKEMFPGLFADPFSHRVHNIAGFLDFNEGTIINGKIMEIDGIPTIVSTSRKECVWISKEYEMPEPIFIDAIAWELATSIRSPVDSFNYKIKIECKDINGTLFDIIYIDSGADTEDERIMLKADAPRAVDGLNFKYIKKFQITFTAKVFEDSYLTERHLPSIIENLGRPLLRAINILEPVESIYEIHSLLELQNLCSDFKLYESPGPEIKRLTATLDLSAVLVNSINQNISNNDIYDPASKYEYIELQLLTDQFARFEAKLNGEELQRN